MSEARDEILARIGAALIDRPKSPVVDRSYRRDVDGEPVALFAERVDDYRATVTTIRQAELPTAIPAALALHGVRRLVIPPDLPLSWLAFADIEVIVDAPPRSAADIEAADGVLTGAALGIAVTGTIVLDAGPWQGRRVLTLLPDLHICVVRADQIVGSVPEAIARLDPRRPQTWISGPSATSDIELKRVEGVHGPRNLHVIIAC